MIVSKEMVQGYLFGKGLPIEIIELDFDKFKIVFQYVMN